MFLQGSCTTTLQRSDFQTTQKKKKKKKNEKNNRFQLTLLISFKNNSMKKRDDAQYKIQLSENLKSADKVSTIYLAL